MTLFASLATSPRSRPEFDDMLHLLRVARPVVPAALRDGLRNQGDTSAEECPGSFSGKLE